LNEYRFEQNKSRQDKQMADPKYLYKFRSFRDENHKRMLTDNELFFPSPDKFNDPFDCCVPMRYDDFTKNEFIRHWTLRFKEDFPNARDNDIRKKVKDFYNRFRSPDGRKMMAKIQEETIRLMRSKDIGVFSLTANLKSILSWSHYADSHRGFCVGFHTWNLKAFLEKCGPLLDLRPVNYTKEYPFINAYRTSDEEKTNKMVWTKSTDWGYENEYRILWLTGANKPLKIPNGVIRRVVLGCQVSPTNIDEMISILRSRADRISLFQAKPKVDSFGLRFDFIRYTRDQHSS
jgi:hypothetical protein